MRNNILNYSSNIYICAIIIIFSSCKSENYFEKIEDPFIESLTTLKSGLTLIVIPLDNQNILTVENDFVWTFIYEEHYKHKYISYFDFLKALYGGKINNLKEYFCNDDIYKKIDKNILKEYDEHGLSFIKDKYLSEYSDSNYEIKTEMFLIKSIRSTVITIMFINEYYIYFDDAGANYFFRKELDELPNVDDITIG